jgi:NADH:ubiquinone oxidoreductase subunit 2 (subunit N)
MTQNFLGLFIVEYLFFFTDFFFVVSILLLLCSSILINQHVKSLFLSRLIIDLTIPIVVLSFFISIGLNNLQVLLEFSSFLLDPLYLFFKSYFFFFLFLCLIFSRNYFLYEKIMIFEYPLLLLLSVQGSFLLLMSYDLFVIYLALELQNLCFYVLAGIKRYSNFSTEAGLKYFLLGAFSSSLFLFGVSIIYGIFGTVNLFDISFTVQFFEVYTPILFMSIFFLLSGLIFKLGGAPFH